MGCVVCVKVRSKGIVFSGNAINGVRQEVKSVVSDWVGQVRVLNIGNAISSIEGDSVPCPWANEYVLQHLRSPSERPPTQPADSSVRATRERSVAST